MGVYDRVKMVAHGLLGLALAGGVTAGRAAESPPDDALWSRLQRIENAFVLGDARSLRSSFASPGKLRVDLDGLTDGRASYAAGQLQVIFGQIFGENRTRELAFERREVTLSSAGTAFARGRWVREPRRGGPSTTERLTFTLREEHGDWHILEIRSSR